MKITLLLFGITTDLIGESSLEIELENPCSILKFKTFLIEKHPQLTNLDNYAIAVNETYANDDYVLKGNDIVAVIPPVSGG